MFGYGIYDVLIIAAFLGVQYFFSTRNNPFWGAIVPILFATWMTISFINGNIESFWFYLIILIIGLLFLFEQWSEGRKSLKKKQEKELEKMQAHDLN
ncbi:hypothetical protein [Oceanobacillus alkalisoli]|uniref:hypothetical protein n=1 Tax=Oceanobacillus alkalisoli TaxID=2925113 RepID=UPI001EF0993C|nr:hypothetical protein [Oceanobacillus alkalisoli]MCF3943414.1 hypothetical protein [Oceanobacillus alkalisoli]MCG5104003.1 hypothetical protein [Oceanobacillus alkalisoli]